MSQPTSIRKRIMEMLEEATQAEEGTIPDGQTLKEMEGFDSMGMVFFIGLVQEQLNVDLSVHDLRETTTAGELCARIMEMVEG